MAVNISWTSLTDSTPSRWAIAAASLLVAVLVAQKFQSWWRLHHIPGPFLNSLTVLPITKLAAGGRISHNMKKMLQQYGPLVRVGPNMVIFGDPETYRRLNRVRSEFTKGPWYGASKMAEVDSIFTSQDEGWRKEAKAKLAPGYAAWVTYEPKIDQVVLTLVDLIERKYISTATEYRPINFSHTATFFSMDALGEISFGEAFGFLREDKDLYNYVEINDSSMPILGVVFTIPWLSKILTSWPFSLALPKKGDKVGFGRLMGLANQIVGKRFEPGAEPRGDMLESHIRNGLNKQEIMAEIFLELLAAVDSTALAIRVILLFLHSTPAALAALRSEIDAAFAAGRISSPVIADSEAYGLPYLQAVIKEGLRMYPPAPGWMAKVPPKGGAEIHGYFVPEGTQISVNILYLLQDPKIFGVDADVFRPERWIEAERDDDPEKFGEMGKALELVFGYGRYQCMGIKIAWMEIHKVVVELLRRFDFAVVDPVQPFTLFDGPFWVCKDFHLRVTKRVSKSPNY